MRRVLSSCSLSLEAVKHGHTISAVGVEPCTGRLYLSGGREGGREGRWEEDKEEERGGGVGRRERGGGERGGGEDGGGVFDLKNQGLGFAPGRKKPCYRKSNSS